MANEIDRDPEYILVEPFVRKKGRQCGKCGAKFDFGTGYGFHCGMIDCPMAPSPHGGQWVTSGMSENGVG